MPSFEKAPITDMSYMFQGCFELENINEVIGEAKFDTSKVRSMFGMFNAAAALKYVDLTSFNISNVGNMGNMFCSAPSLKELNISGWNTSKVWEFSGMFAACRELEKINGVFDLNSCTGVTDVYSTQHYTTMRDVPAYYEMFYGCSKLKGIKIKNPPASFMTKTKYNQYRLNGEFYGYELAGLTRSQFEIVS